MMAWIRGSVIKDISFPFFVSFGCLLLGMEAARPQGAGRVLWENCETQRGGLLLAPLGCWEPRSPSGNRWAPC